MIYETFPCYQIANNERRAFGALLVEAAGFEPASDRLPTRNVYYSLGQQFSNGSESMGPFTSTPKWHVVLVGPTTNAGLASFCVSATYKHARWNDVLWS